MSEFRIPTRLPRSLAIGAWGVREIDRYNRDVDRLEYTIGALQQDRDDVLVAMVMEAEEILCCAETDRERFEAMSLLNRTKREVGRLRDKY